jgi:hypothetical protein
MAVTAPKPKQHVPVHEVPETTLADVRILLDGKEQERLNVLAAAAAHDAKAREDAERVLAITDLETAERGRAARAGEQPALAKFAAELDALAAAKDERVRSRSVYKVALSAIEDERRLLIATHREVLLAAVDDQVSQGEVALLALRKAAREVALIADRIRSARTLALVGADDDLRASTVGPPWVLRPLDVQGHMPSDPLKALAAAVAALELAPAVEQQRHSA